MISSLRKLEAVGSSSIMEVATEMFGGLFSFDKNRYIFRLNGYQNEIKTTLNQENTSKNCNFTATNGYVSSIDC